MAWEVASEEPVDKPAEDAWAVESEQPMVRRGGTRAEANKTAAGARDAMGPSEPDPLLTVSAKQPLPEGVEPSKAGGGRGFVVERRGERAGYMSGQAPLRDRREALDEAVNLLEEGAEPQKVYDTFARMKIAPNEIAAHGLQRGSKFFDPQRTRPANNELIAGATGFDEAKPFEPSALREVGNTVARGAEQFKQSVDSARFLSGGIDASQMAEQMRIGNRRMGALAPSGDVAAGLERLQTANETGEWGPVLEAAASPQNWKALAAMLTESVVSTGPTMLAGTLAMALGGGALGMPVGTAAGFAQEYTAALGDELQKRGVDASDPARVAAALQDPDVREAIDQRGRIRGAAVGAFDGITMGFAGALGRAMRRMQASGTLTKGRAIGGAAAGAAVETSGGMLGEDLAQRGVGESKKLDVLVEGFAEAPSGIVDVATGFLTPRAKPGQPTMPPSQARTDSINRFGEMAAAFGLPEKAVARAREAASGMPAGDVPAFLGKLAEAYSKRGLFAKPLDPQALTELQQAVDGPPEAPPEAPAADQAVSNIEATLKAAGALPDEAITPPGLAEEQAQPAPDAPVAGEPINREWTRFAPESGTLNIPREQMPQIAAEHRGALVNFLNARGVDHDMETVEPSTLKPTQAEFQPKKVAGIAEKGSGRSLLVSQDGHILDGHHQWAAAKESGTPVRVVRLQAPIQDLLRLAHQFPSSTTARGPSKSASAAPQPQSAARPDEGATRGQEDQAQEVLTPAPAGLAAGAPEQQGAANVEPELPVPAASVPGTGAAGPGAAGGSAGTVGPVAADAGRVAAGDPAAAEADGRAGADAGRGGASDGALKPRVIGSYGKTPNGATEIELRPNADGTLTPYTGKYPMVDFESGDPITLPADTTDAQAAAAIREAKAVTKRDKFFGVKPDESSAAPAAGSTVGNGSRGRAAATAEPGAATLSQEEKAADAERRITGLKALLQCLSS